METIKINKKYNLEEQVSFWERPSLWKSIFGLGINRKILETEATLNKSGARSNSIEALENIGIFKGPLKKGTTFRFFYGWLIFTLWFFAIGWSIFDLILFFAEKDNNALMALFIKLLFVYSTFPFISQKFGPIAGIFAVVSFFMTSILLALHEVSPTITFFILALQIYILFAKHTINRIEKNLIMFIREKFYKGIKNVNGNNDFSLDGLKKINFATNTFLSNRYDELEKTTNYKHLIHNTGEHTIDLIEFTTFKSDYFSEKIEIEKGYVFPPQKDILKKINIIMTRNTLGEYFFSDKKDEKGTDYETYNQAITQQELKNEINIFSKPSEVMYTRKFLSPYFEMELLDRLNIIKSINGFTLELKDGAIIIYKKENKYLNWVATSTRKLGEELNTISSLDEDKKLARLPIFAAKLEQLKMEQIEVYSLKSDIDLLNILSFIINEHDRMQFDGN